MDGRVILHVDMDAFYASIEQRDDASLRGRPVIVGGTGARGVVAAASYEVRRFGVRSAMPVREALRRCPQALCVPPRMAHYQAVSRQIFGIFDEFTPLVQGLSLDEAFLDVTASATLNADGERVARQVKRMIRERTSLAASVGVAPNKLVAKIASDLEKPDGLVVVRPAEVNAVLDPLPVRRLSGLGAKTAARVEAACGGHEAADGVRSPCRTRPAARGGHRRATRGAGPGREADQRRGDLRCRHRGTSATSLGTRAPRRQGERPAARKGARGQLCRGQDPPQRLRHLHAAEAFRAADTGDTGTHGARTRAVRVMACNSAGLGAAAARRRRQRTRAGIPARVVHRGADDQEPGSRRCGGPDPRTLRPGRRREREPARHAAGAAGPRTSPLSDCGSDAGAAPDPRTPDPTNASHPGPGQASLWTAKAPETAPNPPTPVLTR